jgi:hypothetical protein
MRFRRKIGLGVLLWITCVMSAAAAAPTPEATGVWYGEIDIAGIAQPFAIAMHERSEGRLIGYVLGGNTSLTMAAGQRSRNRIMLELEFVDATDVETVRIVGQLRDDEVSGTARLDRRVSPLRLLRLSAEDIAERRFIMATVDADGEPVSLTNAGLLLSDGGSPGGFYSTPDECGPFGCAGRVSRYEESVDSSGNPVVDLDLESGDPCPGSGSVHLVFDPSLRLYTGAYAFNDCGGSRAGPLLGSGLSRTQGDHVLAVLATYAGLADDLEQGVTFTSAYPRFATDYLHTSQLLTQRLDELNAQVAMYNTIEVRLSHFRDLSSIFDPFVFPDVDYGFDIDFRDWRQGQSGDEVTIYRDTTTRVGDDELAFLRQQGTDWVIAGNQIRHDLPLAAYTPGVDKVIVPTAGGDVFISIGPWGAHGPPHTGHIEGNSKADWFAEYADRWELMTELEGDGNGLCTSGEVCGIPESDLLDRAASYAAPADVFKIIDVRLRRLDAPGVYYGGDEHWTVRALLGYTTYDFVHVREVAPDLRDAMVLAGYADPWSVHDPSDNLITGAPIVLNRGQTVAWPQIVASPVPGHPGYYSGGGGLGQTPVQQMEWFNHNDRASREESFYELLPADLRAQLERILVFEGINPSSFRYNSPFLAGLEFLTYAEMALSNQPFADRSDYSNMFAGLGGWWEDDGGCSSAAECDELFSIFPISRDTVFYDPSLYDSADVRYLVIHAFLGDPAPVLMGEVVQPFEPDPVSGNMVFRWRNSSGTFLGYQGVGYRLDPVGEMFRIRWGAEVATIDLALSVLPPVPTDTDPCNGETLTCHVHRVQ